MISMIRPRGISSRRGFLAAASLLAILFIAPGIARHADKAAPRAMEPIDILDWKTIGPAAISADGKWLAYRYSPVQGDTSIILRATSGDKEYKFVAGEVSPPPPGPPPNAEQIRAMLAISDDGKWAAFLTYPVRKEAEKLKKAKKPIQSSVALVDLATGKDIDYPKVRQIVIVCRRPKAADTLAYARETRKDYPDSYVSDLAMKNARRITDGQSQVEPFAWSAGGRIIDYTSDAPTTAGNGGVKGKKLQASLHLPANYEPGKKYPTIVYIYEHFSDGFNRFVQPTANGFNKSVSTSNGYAVLMPDITYTVNDPGMSAVWSVLPALRAAIATGIVDPARVGLHGHSWGGYQTSLLVTQTNAFKAAIAGAPLTNMVSMYSLVFKNTGVGNMAIFESSQGRFRGGYWDNWDAYVRNSPIAHASKVQTPLVILHNDKDGAVDFTQGVEYYNTLRRLKKPVVMLQYVGENHGLAKPANRYDYTVRMREYFDHHLKGAPAPAWWTDGVPRLDMDKHLKQRAPKPKKAPAPSPSPTSTTTTAASGG
jgi:dipeptidyl aminopeptidase/acylaminoacyl peptidase